MKTFFLWIGWTGFKNSITYFKNVHLTFVKSAPKKSFAQETILPLASKKYLLMTEKMFTKMAPERILTTNTSKLFHWAEEQVLHLKISQKLGRIFFTAQIWYSNIILEFIPCAAAWFGKLESECRLLVYLTLKFVKKEFSESQVWTVWLTECHKYL